MNQKTTHQKLQMHLRFNWFSIDQLPHPPQYSSVRFSSFGRGLLPTLSFSISSWQFYVLTQSEITVDIILYNNSHGCAGFPGIYREALSQCRGAGGAPETRPRESGGGGRQRPPQTPLRLLVDAEIACTGSMAASTPTGWAEASGTTCSGTSPPSPKPVSTATSSC